MLSGTARDAWRTHHSQLAPSPPHPTPTQVLDAVGESVECVTYDKWVVYPPGSPHFECVCNADAYAENIRCALPSSKLGLRLRLPSHLPHDLHCSPTAGSSPSSHPALPLRALQAHGRRGGAPAVARARGAHGPAAGRCLHAARSSTASRPGRGPDGWPLRAGAAEGRPGGGAADWALLRWIACRGSATAASQLLVVRSTREELPLLLTHLQPAQTWWTLW